MENAVTIEIRGMEKFHTTMRDLEQRVGLQKSRSVLRRASSKTLIKALRRNSTVKSKNLKASFGNVTGKARNVAVIFAGPRIDNARTVNRRTPGGKISVRVAGKYKGHLSNIIEWNKFQKRYPARAGKKTPRIPELGSYPENIRAHTGIFTKRPFIVKTLQREIWKVEGVVAAEMQKLLTKHEY